MHKGYTDYIIVTAHYSLESCTVKITAAIHGKPRFSRGDVDKMNGDTAIMGTGEAVIPVMLTRPGPSRPRPRPRPGPSRTRPRPRPQPSRPRPRPGPSRPRSQPSRPRPRPRPQPSRPHPSKSRPMPRASTLRPQTITQEIIEKLLLMLLSSLLVLRCNVVEMLLQYCCNSNAMQCGNVVVAMLL